MTTYSISPGSQYDPEGATVTQALRTTDLFSAFDAEGSQVTGEPISEPTVLAAIARVLISRVRETVTISPPSRATPAQVRALDIHLERMQRMMDSGSSVY